MIADILCRTGQLSKVSLKFPEDFQHKLDNVVEGRQMLSDKIDRIDGRMDRLDERMDRLENKVDAIAADLGAHRADTEAHHGVHRVKEGGE